MFRSIDKWLAGYARSALQRPRNVTGLKHLMFCVADHFEPFRQNTPRQAAMALVDRWFRDLPVLIEKFGDADGRKPQHTFFYPQEEYDFDCMERLAGLCRAGAGEVEIHLHHRNDTREGLRSKLESFRDTLRSKHGLLGSDGEGNARFGFIHGNWALCNSRPDGDWCGVNEEIGVLRQAGCYADFTFPSAPSPTQPRMVNAIYYASDTGHPGACDTGVRVKVCRHGKQELKPQMNADGRGSRKDNSGFKSQVSGAQSSGTCCSDTSLMLITGPLALDWHRRKWGVFPRLDNGAITAVNPPLPGRIDLWVRRHIHVEGCPEWVFVKVYAHGCKPDDINSLLGSSMFEAYDYLHNFYNDGKSWSLHYVTAREMYNIIKAAEAGKRGNPCEYRDFELTFPPVLKR